MTSQTEFYLTSAVGLLLGVWAFWALYVFTMGLYRAKLDGRLSGLNLVFGYPVVILAALVDVFFNLIVAPFVFLDIPREWLVTMRLKRYMAGPASWRRTIAEYICDRVLDIFDPTGDHC